MICLVSGVNCSMDVIGNFLNSFVEKEFAVSAVSLVEQCELLDNTDKVARVGTAIQVLTRWDLKENIIQIRRSNERDETRI